MIHHYIPFRRSPVKLDRMPSDVDAVTLRSSPGLTDSIYSIAVGDPRVVEDPVVVHCTRTLSFPPLSPPILPGSSLLYFLRSLHSLNTVL